MKFSVVHINNKGGTVGYRSEVAFKCTPEANEVIIAAAELDEGLKKMLKECDNKELWGGEEPTFEPGSGGCYYWSGVKWYEGYADVDAFERIMSMLENMCLEAEFGFIRLGEDYDDQDMRGDPGQFDMYINRSIEL